jgi:hypothetical protein
MRSDLPIDTRSRHEERSSRWAPWWIYVLVIVPVNLGKEQVLPDDTAWWLRAGLTAIIVVAGIAVVTALHRAGRETRGQ